MPLFLSLSSFFSLKALTHLQGSFDNGILISCYFIVDGIFCALTPYPRQDVDLC